ncbi:Coq4 family protein [Flagellimonas myxillae]|uniref:Coq4 family protein n=1 Tax=Flagellimonas myxillae TaxID=2942214 RepID=UPI00201FA2A1|nr:Coq4 family protein [Muricauda myxillae]MCL6265092.1 Coq4 family protein [Muricauda myxillae]
MKKLRKHLVIWLFENSQKRYTQWFKHHPGWQTDREALLQLPSHSLGYALGQFLTAHNFELIPKVERHDVYHVLTGYGTQVEDEIALQYLCFGNGKRSPYLLGAIVLGTLLLPEYIGYYLRSYQKGKKANAFYQLDFEKLLTASLTELRSVFFGTCPKPTFKKLSISKTL